MRQENNILNNKFYSISVYITNFFITNFWFLLMISPVLIYLYKFEGSISISVLLFISVLIGPAITTLFSIMGKLIREGEVAPTKDFFHFYKLNFFQGLLAGIILNTLMGIVYLDMNYFSSRGDQYVSYFFLALLVLIIMLNMYVYPIISRYNIKIVDIFKLSVKLLIKKIYISLSCISIIIITFGVCRITRLLLVAFLLGVSIACYLIMKVEERIINELEKEINEKYKVN